MYAIFGCLYIVQNRIAVTFLAASYALGLKLNKKTLDLNLQFFSCKDWIGLTITYIVMEDCFQFACLMCINIICVY